MSHIPAKEVAELYTWLHCITPREDATARLFCFPHAGGSDSSFAAMAKEMPETIEVFVVNPPGRGRRAGEPLIEDWDVLKDKIVEVLSPLLNKPSFFFGHSAGALVAFGVLEELQQHQLPLPKLVMFSGHGAPHTVETLPTGWQTTDKLTQLVREWGGTDEALLNDAQSLPSILGPIRADLTIAETIRQRTCDGTKNGSISIPCSILVLYGENDDTVTSTQVDAWEQLQGPIPDSLKNQPETWFSTCKVKDGSHFYFEDSEQARETVKQLIVKRISSMIKFAVDEAYLQLETWNSGTMDYPHDKCLHHLFEEQARKTPDLPAVFAGGVTLTFHELDVASATLARRLQKEHQVGPEAIVGIFMERSLEYVIAYLGILRAGGAYMPLELVYPPELLDRVLTETNATSVITKSMYQEHLPDWYKASIALEYDSNWMSEQHEKGYHHTDLIPAEMGPDNLAFVVMSSGTTGVPKGIINPHRGAVHSYHWRYVHHPYEDGEREAAGVFFVWEVIRPLLRGKPIYVIPDETVFDPVALVQYLCQHSITRVLFTPSLAELILDQGGEQLREKLQKLKIIWLCGEVVTLELRNRLVELLPTCQILNLYSISECHDVSVSNLNKLDSSLFPEYAPCGRPMENVRVFVLDEHLTPQPIGVPGEVYVAGPCLARGYLKMPEKTAERFIQVPSRLAKRPDELMYRTGDRGRLLASGDLELIGRCDFMVKVRGYSVVLGAVETAIIAHESIASAVVVTDGDEGQDKRLVAYVVPETWKSDSLPSAASLRKFLKGKLPAYAIPSVFVVLDSLPLHQASMKLDRKGLPSVEVAKRLRASSLAHEGELGETHVPSTKVEIGIADVWHKLLRMAPDYVMNTHESFFDIGGHSLLATRAIAAVQEVFGVKVPLGRFLQGPTIAEMSKVVEVLLANDSNGNPEELLEHNSINLALEAEALDHSIYPASTRKTGYSRFRPQLASWVPRRVFLTGATGFLGAFILAELIQNTSTIVFCLVRSPSPVPTDDPEGEETPPGLSRIIDTLKKYSLLDDETLAHLEQRVVPIVGDLSRPLLGLKDSDFRGLASEVDCIVHNGAEVNLVKSYADLKAANVLATQEVLRLAVTNGLWQTRVKPVHFVSTNSVFSWQEAPTMENPWVCREDDDISGCWTSITEGYSQSKWVAERMVHIARDRGLPACIFRPGNMGPSTSNGAWNSSDFVYLTIMGCAKLGCAPGDVDWKFDITPVDFAAKAIVHLACKSPSKSLGHVFHVQNPDEPISAASVFESMAASRPGFQLLSVEEWRSRLSEAARNEDQDILLQRLAVGIDSFIPYFGTKAPKFKCEGLTQVLRSSGLCCPSVDTETFTKAIEFAGL